MRFCSGLRRAGCGAPRSPDPQRATKSRLGCGWTDGEADGTRSGSTAKTSDRSSSETARRLHSSSATATSSWASRVMDIPTRREPASDQLSWYRQLVQSTASQCPLQFWCSNMAQCPELAELAISVLDIPACETTCERQFSQAGLMFSDLRSRLKPKTLADMLFVYSNDPIIKTMRTQDEEKATEEEARMTVDEN